jgi:hypothetical protein
MVVFPPFVVDTDGGKKRLERRRALPSGSVSPAPQRAAQEGVGFVKYMKSG